MDGWFLTRGNYTSHIHYPHTAAEKENFTKRSWKIVGIASYTFDFPLYPSSTVITKHRPAYVSTIKDILRYILVGYGGIAPRELKQSSADTWNGYNRGLTPTLGM